MRAAGSVVRTEKVVLLGSTGAGKTSIANRAVQDLFRNSTESTVGAAFLTKTFTVEGVQMRLDIWDTGGSERYRSLAPMYYRDARAAIVVFDLTDAKSQQEAIEWLSEVRTHGRKDIVCICAANKCDLAGNRVLKPAEVTDFGFKNQFEFIQETSAKTGMGVSEIFNECVRLLRLLPEVPQPVATIPVGNTGNSSGCKC
jgi:small GTP-binding protein